MERQCVLQMLPLPSELISIIKDYSFYTKIEKLARDRMKKIMKIIKHSFHKKINMDSFIFWSHHRKDPQFQIVFCSCGNYALFNTRISRTNKHVCQC